MRDTIVHDKLTQLSSKKTGLANRLARQMLQKRLSRLRHGQIIISDGGSSVTYGSTHHGDGLVALADIIDQRFYRSIVFGGSIGAAEAYMEGFWQCNDLVALIRIIIKNREVLFEIEKGFASMLEPFHNVMHARRRNTRNGSAKNIRAHYDIGNDFYKVFLDETMMYSGGIFELPASTMKEASVAKNDRICKKLRLSPEDHLLEIGTGWGGFAIHAAANYGCRITTTTISREQYEYAKERVSMAGLHDRITLLLEDYRELKGSYDKVASIEMIEAVGHEFLPVFFLKCERLMKRAGLMALQGITIADQAHKDYIKSVDFIKHYIFPGGSLISITSLCSAATLSSDFRLVHLEDITPHYAATLNNWRRRFEENIDRVRSMGYPEGFIRMWIYYLSYCEAGFAERSIGNVQMLFARPEWRGDTLFL
jgi:cyclopropane-fatty-acyl-phospholipid synthase